MTTTDVIMTKSFGTHVQMIINPPTVGTFFIQVGVPFENMYIFRKLNRKCQTGKNTNQFMFFNSFKGYFLSSPALNQFELINNKYKDIVCIIHV